MTYYQSTYILVFISVLLPNNFRFLSINQSFVTFSFYFIFLMHLEKTRCLSRTRLIVLYLEIIYYYIVKCETCRCVESNYVNSQYMLCWRGEWVQCGWSKHSQNSNSLNVEPQKSMYDLHELFSYLGVASKPNRRLTGGSVGFRAVVIV